MDMSYWVISLVLALSILIVLLWRNFDIDEITPAPPFVKFKRKQKNSENSNHPSHSVSLNSINIRRNLLIGRNKLRINSPGVNVADNKMAGQNEVEVNSKTDK